MYRITFSKSWADQIYRFNRLKLNPRNFSPRKFFGRLFEQKGSFGQSSHVPLICKFGRLRVPRTGWQTIPREHSLERIQKMIWVWPSYNIPLLEVFLNIFSDQDPAIAIDHVIVTGDQDRVTDDRQTEGSEITHLTRKYNCHLQCFETVPRIKHVFFWFEFIFIFEWAYDTGSDIN